MAEYLGATIVPQNQTPYADYTADQWALLYIFKYGPIDGDHHKTWVLDQVTRILNGASVEIKLAKWDNGNEEYRFNVGESEAYNKWVEEYRFDEDGEEYGYDEGIAP